MLQFYATKSRSLLFLLMALFPPCALSALGSNSNTNPSSLGRIIIKERLRIPNKRPKAPSAQQIFCYYEDGSLTFDFVIPEGDCSVTVTNLSNNHVAAYSISSEDEAVIYVGELSHAYIEVYTATGHEYEGYLE